MLNTDHHPKPKQPYCTGQKIHGKWSNFRGGRRLDFMSTVSKLVHKRPNLFQLVKSSFYSKITFFTALQHFRFVDEYFIPNFNFKLHRGNIGLFVKVAFTLPLTSSAVYHPQRPIAITTVPYNRLTLYVIFFNFISFEEFNLEKQLRYSSGTQISSENSLG